MTDSPFMPLAGIARPYDDRRCGYTPTLRPEDACLAPATWHIAWDAEMNNSVDCDEHMAAVERTAVYYDRHRLSPDCIMPGAEWFADRCLVPHSEGQAAEAAQPEETVSQPR